MNPLESKLIVLGTGNQASQRKQLSLRSPTKVPDGSSNGETVEEFRIQDQHAEDYNLALVSQLEKQSPLILTLQRKSSGQQQ